MKNVYKCKNCRACEENCSIFLETGSGAAYEKLTIIERLQNGKPLTTTNIDTLFMCTKCEACQECCPEKIPLIDLYDWARHEIVQKYGLRNQKQQVLIQNIIQFGNPFGNGGSRLLGVEPNLLKRRVFRNSDKFAPSSTLLHFGCMLGYRLQSMRDDTLEILRILNIDYALLENELCCGYFIWNTGDHESARTIIEKNQKHFKKFDKIICACAGCYTFFKEHYPNPEKFVHFIEVINQNLPAKEINKPVKKYSEESYIFHDSCHLTRPHKIIKPPRSIMKRIGIKLEEFPHSSEKGLCCGANGGMRIINPELAVRIGKVRVQEAKKSAADALLTLCPFCIFNFRDALPEEEHGLAIKSLYNEIKQWLSMI
jgi:fumarate reductase (CoM/CoB) subunit B